MSVYKVAKDRTSFPLHYLAGTGKYATPADDAAHTSGGGSNSPLAVDERGNPKVVYELVNKGGLVYNTQADFDALSDDEKRIAYYVFDQATLDRYLAKSELYTSRGFKPVLEDYSTSTDGVPASAEKAEDDAQEEDKPKKAPRKNSNKNNND